MAEALRVICSSETLVERGPGVRFTVEYQEESRAAFAIRYNGNVHAYLNRCAHAGVELDAIEGEFFDLSRLYLICSSHGAAYEPESGHCALGPCRGQRLIALPVAEHGGKVMLIERGGKNDV